MALKLDPIWTLTIGLAILALGSMIVWPDHGVLARWRKARGMTKRVLVEDALKFVQKRETLSEAVALEGVAGSLNVSMNEAAELLEQMQRAGLIRADERGFHLTSQGRELALHIVRAHRLWERYLAEETGFSESEWHSKADAQEHTLSPAAAELLASQLGHPRFDPHGDPIPTRSGRSPAATRGFPLTALEPGTVARITHVEDEPEVLYAQLVAEGIHPGMEVHMVDASAERVTFWAGDREHVLAPMLAANVSVAEMPRDEKQTEESDVATLDTLALGEQAEVSGLSEACRGAERRRLLDLGVLPGTRVIAEMRSPVGDPTAYRIRDTLIALREQQAQLVRIRVPEAVKESNGG
jgi:DtxR family Mn-dependent transcriptional regulator